MTWPQNTVSVSKTRHHSVGCPPPLHPQATAATDLVPTLGNQQQGRSLPQDVVVHTRWRRDAITARAAPIAMSTSVEGSGTAVMATKLLEGR